MTEAMMDDNRLQDIANEARMLDKRSQELIYELLNEIEQMRENIRTILDI